MLAFVSRPLTILTAIATPTPVSLPCRCRRHRRCSGYRYGFQPRRRCHPALAVNFALLPTVAVGIEVEVVDGYGAANAVSLRR
ncbi:MAG: hypothetical protein MZV64_15865 [Ignavibacteriales bacterium]|nr:hypothetical protein [Ignavibacteriales bacterium]